MSTNEQYFSMRVFLNTYPIITVNVLKYNNSRAVVFERFSSGTPNMRDILIGNQFEWSLLKYRVKFNILVV